MDKLIVQPLKKADISTVIVIDVLDECEDDEHTSAILAVLMQFVSQIILPHRPPRFTDLERLPSPTVGEHDRGTEQRLVSTFLPMDLLVPL